MLGGMVARKHIAVVAGRLAASLEQPGRRH
jgi:hypothetical protein